MLTGNLVLIAALALATAPEGPSWPGFRGPIAESVRAADLPLRWSPTTNIAWKADITGYGQSSPVVWGDHVYVTSVLGPNKETCYVTALELRTGKSQWQYSIENASPRENTGYVSKAAPTPVADSAGIVCLFEGGNLMALDHEGKLRWERNLVAEMGPIEARHGLGSSLAQTDTLVFVWIERQNDPYVLAIEKKTGRNRWKIPGLGAASWSTPVLTTVNGTRQLVLSGSGLVRGFDPATGRVLWTLGGLSGNATPSPQPAGDGLLLIGATVGQGEEGGGRASDSNVIARIEAGADGRYSARFVWKAARATSSFGSPIVHRKLAYFVNASGVLFCLDAQNGAEVYAQRTADSVWATPLAVGERIYFFGKNGVTTVVRAGREFELLAENRLWSDNPGGPSPATRPPGGQGPSEKIQYAAAAVPGHLLIRSGGALFCIGDNHFNLGGAENPDAPDAED